MADKGDSVYYFAYGAEIDPGFFLTECSSSAVPIDIAFCEHYELRFFKQAQETESEQEVYLPDMVFNEGSIVWGVVYETFSRNFYEIQTAMESLKTRLVKRDVVIKPKTWNERLIAEAYFAKDREKRKEGLPTEDYINKMINGAKFHFFPETYIQQLLEIKNKILERKDREETPQEKRDRWSRCFQAVTGSLYFKVKGVGSFELSLRKQASDKPGISNFAILITKNEKAVVVLDEWQNNSSADKPAKERFEEKQNTLHQEMLGQYLAQKFSIY